MSDEKTTKKVVVVGGGLIGIETCEALHLAGFDITIVEILPQLLTFLDWQLAKLVEDHVRSKGANVITENGITAFLGDQGKLTGVKLQNGTELECELAVVAIGVAPNTQLARDAGLQLGRNGGILVNEYMKTSDPDITPPGIAWRRGYHHRCNGACSLRGFGEPQGRVAGENAVVGDMVTFPGTIQTGICKIFDFAAGFHRSV